jgi:hypothetical protein
MARFCLGREVSGLAGDDRHLSGYPGRRPGICWRLGRGVPSLAGDDRRLNGQPAFAGVTVVAAA